MTKNVTPKVDIKSLEEAVSDVGIGFIISFPVGLITLGLCAWLELSVTLTAFIQTIIFTAVSLIRKYFVRTYFKSKGY